MRIMAIKPAKKPALALARSDKRLFPAYRAGVTSTAAYVRAYFGLNVGLICPPDYYHPLPDTPAAVSDVTETVEVEA